MAGTLISTFVIVAVGAILAYLTNDKSMGLRTKFDGLRTDVKSEVGEVKSSIARLEDRLDAGLASMHSEIVQVALAVGARGQSARG